MHGQQHIARVWNGVEGLGQDHPKGHAQGGHHQPADRGMIHQKVSFHEKGHKDKAPSWGGVFVTVLLYYEIADGTRRLRGGCQWGYDTKGKGICQEFPDEEFPDGGTAPLSASGKPFTTRSSDHSTPDCIALQ